jgi:integrase/recombinase XerD
LSFEQLKLVEEYQSKSRCLESQQLLVHPLLDKDVWRTIDDLNLKINEHNRYLTINFTQISQDWLKLLVKVYILLKAKPATPVGTICKRLECLKVFSKFLEEKSVYSPNQINDRLLEDFDCYISLKGLSQNTINHRYVLLCNFFDTCRYEGWLNINTYWFKGKRKPHCYPNNDDVSYLPEEVWNQLDHNLQYLPEPLQRMVLIIRTTGVRIGEICNMPFDCLRKRGEQWRIRFTTEKYDLTDEMPIAVPELVVVIKEQQEYIRLHLGEVYDKLFCGSRVKSKGIKTETDEMLFKPQPKIMGSYTFNKWLNRLAKLCKICSKNGEIWHFHSHQFRHTVATVMINVGVRELIIQKYLRHRSPDMQRHYTHLFKQVLGDEVKKLMQEKKYVDVSGRVATSYKPKNIVTELLRQKMHQVTTQYGECHRPAIQTPCQTINACWQCQYWRTSTDDLPFLKDDLNRIKEELKLAEETGMVRQQQGLENNRDSLLNCIKELEQINE